MRMATPSPKRRASPRQSAAAWRSPNARWAVRAPRRVAEPSITSSCTSANACSISKAAPASITCGVVGVAAGGHEAPVAEGRPQPLAAAHHQRPQRLERRHEVGAQLGPARALGGEERVEAVLDPLGHREEARRDGDDGRVMARAS